MSKTPGASKVQPIVPASTSPLKTLPSYKRTSTNRYGSQKGKMQSMPSERLKSFQYGIQLQKAQKMQTNEIKEATTTVRNQGWLSAGTSTWLILLTMLR